MVLRLFWLGVIEATRPELCPSFFQVDLAPTILGFLCPDDAPSPLDPETLGSLHRDNALHLAPPTLDSPRRGDTSSPSTPEILGVLSDNTSPPMIPEIRRVLGRDYTSPHLAPEFLGALDRGDTPHPPLFPAYISHHPDRPPPTLPFPVPSILANTHSATPAHSMSLTVQLARTTTNHQNIAPSMPGFNPLPSGVTMQRGLRPLARSWSCRAYTSVLYNVRVNKA